MAIDPATAKIIVQHLISMTLDEEKRNSIILAIVILIVIFTLVVLVPIYLITNPIETTKLSFSESDIELIEQLKSETPSILQKGELVFEGKYPLPLQGVITCDYGYRISPITGNLEKHTGIDISGKHHDNIISIANGVVTFSGTQNGFGNCIELKHEIDGEVFYSFYAHMSRLDVVINQQVEQGDIIRIRRR